MGLKQSKVLTKAKTVNVIAAKVTSGKQVEPAVLRMVELRRGESQEEPNWLWE